MKNEINSINQCVQNIFDELCILESLAVLLKNYFLNNTYKLSSLPKSQKQSLCFEKCNCINITDLAIATIEKIKNKNENLEKKIYLLKQYTNDSSR